MRGFNKFLVAWTFFIFIAVIAVIRFLGDVISFLLFSFLDVLRLFINDRCLVLVFLVAIRVFSSRRFDYPGYSRPGLWGSSSAVLPDVGSLLGCFTMTHDFRDFLTFFSIAMFVGPSGDEFARMGMGNSSFWHGTLLKKTVTLLPMVPSGIAAPSSFAKSFYSPGCANWGLIIFMYIPIWRWRSSSMPSMAGLSFVCLCLGARRPLFPFLPCWAVS